MKVTELQLQQVILWHYAVELKYCNVSLATFCTETERMFMARFPKFSAVSFNAIRDRLFESQASRRVNVQRALQVLNSNAIALVRDELDAIVGNPRQP